MLTRTESVLNKSPERLTYPLPLTVASHHLDMTTREPKDEAAAALPRLIEQARSESRGGRAWSKHSNLTGKPTAAAGLYERNKADKDVREESGGTERWESRSRSTSLSTESASNYMEAEFMPIPRGRCLVEPSRSHRHDPYHSDTASVSRKRSDGLRNEHSPLPTLEASPLKSPSIALLMRESHSAMVT